jgi:hypothetical protein
MGVRPLWRTPREMLLAKGADAHPRRNAFDPDKGNQNKSPGAEV